MAVFFGPFTDEIKTPAPLRRGKKGWIMDAKLKTKLGEIEIRYATRKSDTWPGYHETCPLGKKGFWAGTEQEHKHIGTRKEDLQSYIDFLSGE